MPVAVVIIPFASSVEGGSTKNNHLTVPVAGFVVLALPLSASVSSSVK